MHKKKKWLDFPFWICCAILAGELLIFADCIGAFLGKALPVKLFVLLLMLVTALLYLLCRGSRKKWIGMALAAMTGTAVFLAVCFAGWKLFSHNAQYRDADSGKQRLYGDQKIMVIVPHEDDEINLMGGVMEAYLAYGSEVYVVFVTNGDFDFSADVRIGEAIAATEHVGIPEDHVIFLGYGDQWDPEGPHLYNAEPGTVVESAAGETETYGTEEHPAYRVGQPYTSDNLLKDLEDVILEYRPEVIFCSDYDKHIDHRAVSLAFEKAMGNLLKRQRDYRPVVMKGYAYGTAWAAAPDYYGENIRSTQNIYGEPCMQEPVIYRWEDRVRLPVLGSVLSRSVFSSKLYSSLEMHESQNAQAEAVKIINGDKAFWYRDTNSLCYSASVAVSSGDPELLRDFMLVDDHCLTDEELLPYDGVWKPEQEDAEKVILVTFDAPADIGRVVLYDHPSEQDNILDLEIAFSDGTQVRTGGLNRTGQASLVPVSKAGIEWLEIRFLEWEGTSAGISELEVFETVPQQPLTFIKLMDEAGDYAYDYWTAEDGTAVFSLQTGGQLPAVCKEHYSVVSDNENCSVTWEEDRILMHCPEGEGCVLTVACGQENVSDSIWVRNPGRLLRIWNGLWQNLEEQLLPYCHSGWHRKTVLYRVCEKILG